MASRKTPRARPRNIERVLEATREQHAIFRDGLPMIASENLTSLTVRCLLTSDFAHRYAEGTVGHRYYQGCGPIDEVEAIALDLARRLFRAEHANVQPISGMNANLAAFAALAKPGDTLLSLGVSQGGHISHAKFSTAGMRGLKVEHHPFRDREMEIDIEGMVRRIREVRPPLVVLGGSLIPFPHPVREAAGACREVGARLMYDGAHVLGLIAGGQFQDPLREGADVLSGSTHKTLPGPQGGILLSTREVAEKLDFAVYPGSTSNHHLHHIAALAVALEEMRLHGRAYARDIVKNARSLAGALHDRGFTVLGESRGYTQSHQVILEVSANGGGAWCAETLEKARIIANKNLLPWDPVGKSIQPSGVRLGVQELTRLGMGPGEMEEVAGLFQRILLRREPPARAARDVTALKKRFPRVHYSFDSLYFPRSTAYQWLDEPRRN